MKHSSTMKILFLTLILTTWQVIKCNEELTCNLDRLNLLKERCPILTKNNKKYMTSVFLQNGHVESYEDSIKRIDQDEIKEAHAIAKNLTGEAIDIVKKMRNFGDDWFKTSLFNIRTFFCNLSEDERVRCVDKHSDDAAVDSENNCIIVNDKDNCNQYGMCERTGNCYWIHPEKDSSKRLTWYDDDDVLVADDWIKGEYAKSFAPYVVPGVLLSVIATLSWLIFCFLRCCCNRCWGRNPKEKGYSRYEIFTPSIIFIICTLGIATCGIVAYVQNEQITDGVFGVLDSVETWIYNLNTLTKNVLEPLTYIRDSVNETSYEIDLQLHDTNWVQDDFQDLQDMMKSFGDTYSNIGPYPFENCNPENDNSCITCPQDVCGNARNEITKAESEMERAKIVLYFVVKVMKDNISQKKESIISSLETADKIIESVFNLTNESQTDVNLFREQFEDLSNVRLYGVLSMFVIGLLISIFGLVGVFFGICSRKSPLINSLHVSWIFGVVVCILGFAFTAVVFTLSILWYDGCRYMDIIVKDTTPYFPYQIAKVANSCFQDINLVEGLDMGDQLNFPCLLNEYFEESNELNVNEKFQNVYDYGKQINTYTKSKFGYDAQAHFYLIDIANKAIKTTSPSNAFSESNLLTPWIVYGSSNDNSNCKTKESNPEKIPLCYMENKCGSNSNTCYEGYKMAFSYQLSFIKIDKMINEMKKDFNGDNIHSFSSTWKFSTSIREASQAYAAKLQNLQDSVINKLKEGLVGKITDKLDQMRCSMTCGWLNNSYQMLHENLCETLLGATLTITLCIFTMCILLIPIVVCAIILQKRLRGIRKGSKEARALASKKSPTRV